jgi:hypothetical protein
MDARLGNVAGRELFPQLLNDGRRPHAVETLPRCFLAHRGAEMIAKRHGTLLHRDCITAINVDDIGTKVSDAASNSGGHARL